jgi:hypothetical protein
MQRDPLQAACAACRNTASVTRALWDRLKGRMACGHCRKITNWSTAP